MTNTPGDGQTPQDPLANQPGQNQPGQNQPGQNQPGQDQPGQDQPGQDQPGQDPPGYWAQHAQQPYTQQPYTQPAYGQVPGYPAQAPMQYAPDHPRATTALVLGILGIVLCGVIAPFAWSVGKKTVAEIDASNGTIGGRGAANAGYIMGIIGTILLGLSVLLVVALLGFAVLGAATSVSTSTY